MGTKKIKHIILGLAILLLTIVFASPKNFAADENLPINVPVRVAIGNQNWSTFNYNKISLFGTLEITIIDKVTNKQIGVIPADTLFDVVLKDGVFEISYPKKELECFVPPTTITPIATSVAPEEKEVNNVFKTPNNFVLKTQGMLGITNLKRKGKQALYRTSIEIVKKPKYENNLFYIVNLLDIQDYLKGVVPNEMPTYFGLEALKAQAVAARNYVLSPRTRLVKEYDVVDSVASQVYFGANTEETTSNRAVKETNGIVASYNWKLILAQYSSTAGGYTESWQNAFPESFNKIYLSNPHPYLTAKADMLTQQPLRTEEDVRAYYMNKPDSYDIRSPYYRWQKNWTKEELQEVLSKTLVSQSKTGFVSPKLEKAEDFGELVDLVPRRRGDSGKLIELEIVTTNGSFFAQKELIIRRLFQKNNISLPSANVVFDFVRDYDNNITEITAYGGGFGHGVGLSQYGAGFMGKELKMPYDKILKHYYTNISLGSAPVIISAHPTQQKVTQNIYLDYKNANLVLDNKFNLYKINLIVNGVETTIPLTQQGMSFRQPLKIDISNLIKKGENTITFCYPLDEGKSKAARLFIEAVNPNADKYGF